MKYPLQLSLAVTFLTVPDVIGTGPGEQWVPDPFPYDDGRYCDRFLELENTFYDVNIVVGEPWKTYHTNIKGYTEVCEEHTFFIPDRPMLKEFFSQFSPKLKVYLNWHAPAVVWEKPNATSDFFLLETSSPGRYDGIPFEFSEDFQEGTYQIKVQMKLLKGGKYLFVANCDNGEYLLMSRSKHPYRKEIDAVAEILELPGGHQACVQAGFS